MGASVEILLRRDWWIVLVPLHFVCIVMHKAKELATFMPVPNSCGFNSGDQDCSRDGIFKSMEIGDPIPAGTPVAAFYDAANSVFSERSCKECAGFSPA